MAQHIVTTWNTVVSVGLHRDSPVDALGQPKPFGKQGYHAHVYFPTRALAFEPDAVRDADEDGQGGSDGWRFAEKLHAFSKKKAASLVITELNAQWAALANTHVAEIGGVPDFTHLSYKRLGLDKVGQQRLGLSASAMERRGIRTDKGDTLRAQQGSEWPEVVASADRAPAAVMVNDALRETATPAVAPNMPAQSPSARTPLAWLNPVDPIRVRPIAPPVPAFTMPAPGSLAGRFLAELAEKIELPQPAVEQRHRLVEWLQRIEQALRRLAAIALRLADLRERRQRDDTARATFLIEGDDRRRRRAEARQSVADWLDAHPWQVRLSRMMGGVQHKPADLVALEGTLASFNAEVQQFKRGAADAAGRVAALDAHITTAETDERRDNEKLTTLVHEVTALEPLYGFVLLSAAESEQVARLTAVLPPAPQPSNEAGVAVTLRTPSAELTVPAARPRLM